VDEVLLGQAFLAVTFYIETSV